VAINVKQYQTKREMEIDEMDFVMGGKYPDGWEQCLTDHV